MRSDAGGRVGGGARCEQSCSYSLSCLTAFRTLIFVDCQTYVVRLAGAAGGPTLCVMALHLPRVTWSTSGTEGHWCPLSLLSLRAGV